jgi:membrane protein
MTVSEARPTLRGFDRGDYKALARGLLSRMKDDDVASLAAGVAFRIFLSLFPALFAAVAAFTVAASGQDIVRLLDNLEFIPVTIRDQIEQPMVRFVERAGGAATMTIVAGIAGGLWAASSAAVMLAKALTRIFGATETRKFLRLRLVGVVIALALFVALVALVVLLVAGRGVQRLALETLPLRTEADQLLSAALTMGRFLLAAMVLIVLFAFVYWVAPDRQVRPRFRWLTPGSVLGVLGWIALSGLFSMYTRIAGENEFYGALGGVIVLLLWLQLSMIVLLLGAAVNAELRRFHAARMVRGEDGGRRGDDAVRRSKEPGRDRGDPDPALS